MPGHGIYWLETGIEAKSLELAFTIVLESVLVKAINSRAFSGITQSEPTQQNETALYW